MPRGTTAVISARNTLRFERANAVHRLALGQGAVAHGTATTVAGLEIGMLAEKIGDLGLHGRSQEDARSGAEHLGQLVVEGSRLNQLDEVVLGHGISLLR
jgi:hypothetical protein